MSGSGQGCFPGRKGLARIAACVVAWCSAMDASAALEWETMRIDAAAEATASSYEAVFRFRNAGNAAVEITNLTTSCGCTVADLAQRRYAPGESGAVKVIFHFEEKVGLQQNVVLVTTSDAPGNPLPLVLRVAIPEILAADRRLLEWRIGAPAQPKIVFVRTAGETGGVRDVHLSQIAAGFDADITPLSDGRTYRLRVQPRDTSRLLRAEFRVRAMVNDRPRELTIHGFVQ